MWRRVPLVPILFGIFGAWALLVVIGFTAPHVYSFPVVGAAAAAGGLIAVLVHAVASQRPSSRLTTTGSVRRGCVYAAVGYVFFATIAAIAGLMTKTTLVIRGAGPALLSFVAFGGLGVVGGIALLRYRSAEAERQQLEVARDLQQRLLPPPQLEFDRYRVTARNVPAIYVAGDFYDFIRLSGDRLLIVLADVAGKGVAAGLIVASTKAVIPLLAAEEKPVEQIAAELSDRLTSQLSRREFVAAILAIYDPASGKLSLSNAGLPDPLLVRSGSSTPVTLPGARYPLGIRSGIGYEAVEIDLSAGDRVVFFTDGLAEAAMGGEPLGYDRLQREIERARGDLDALFGALGKLVRGIPDDDWTAVLLERLG